MTHCGNDVGCEPGKFEVVGVSLSRPAQWFARTRRFAIVEIKSAEKYAHLPESFHSFLNSVSMTASRNTPGRLVHGRLPHQRNAPWTHVLDSAR